jgi:hypothetical protein
MDDYIPLSIGKSNLYSFVLYLTFTYLYGSKIRISSFKAKFSKFTAVTYYFSRYNFKPFIEGSNNLE